MPGRLHLGPILLLILKADKALPLFASQGFYVTIDFHFEQSGLQNNPTLFASAWRRLWTDMVSLPTHSSKLEGRVFPELANEWDKFGCRWDTAGGRSESLRTGGAGLAIASSSSSGCISPCYTAYMKIPSAVPTVSAV